ncbi:CCA tRNA nucleotidyltransferase [Brevibacterium senegalense]|uniref:CCA tRNA nucleotidyltransferase n=1 Tax=Brevibacterium senegalense TaxID=1033736 RepID=UPI0003000078
MDAAAAHARMFDALDQLSPILDPLAERFAQRGFELALVGGSVRDALLGRDMPDLDFTTDARPDDILAAIRGWADAHWDIGKQFGTIGLRKGDRLIEITTYRAEQYDPDSRKPVVAFGDTLDADLVRRDFTIGAMAVRLPGRVFVDPHGGLSDLAAGLIRTPGTPEDSFSDDPLRMMRGARFTSQLDFRVADEVRDAMTRMSDRIDIISAERVRDELVKLITGLRPRAGIELLVETGICERILPEFAALRDQQDEHNRHKDVYEHSLTVLDQAVELEKEYARRDAEAAAGAGDGSADEAGPSTPPFTSPDFIVRFAALMHDVGKPRTRRFDSSGGVTFHHHDVVGAKMTAKRMRALAFDKDTLTKVARLVELHLRFYGYGDAGWTDSAVRRYVTDSGDLLTRLHILTRSDVTTRNRRKANRLARNYDELEQRIAALAEKEALDAIRPELDGTRIMEILDIPPGPLVGQAYRFLLELRLEEGVVGEDEAARRLRAWHTEGGGASS